MIDIPQIVQVPARQTAVIRFNIPRAEIQQVMGPGFGELFSTLAAQGIPPAGPAFSRHFRMDPGTFDLEIGIPVPSPVAPAGRVKPGELPAATVARTVYHGSYDGLGPGWGEFMTWIQTHGHTPAAELWEYYTAGPESDPDPTTWRTELNKPLMR